MIDGPTLAAGAPVSDEARRRSDDGRIESRVPWATLGLLALIVAAFAAEHVLALAPETGLFVPSGLTLQGFGGLTSGAVLKHGQVLCLFSSMLLHTKPAHLFANAAALLLTGCFLERLVGRSWFSALFVASSLGGAIAALNVEVPQVVVMVGASAGIMGLLGAMLVFSFRRASLGRRRASMSLLATLLIILTLIPGGDGPADRVVYCTHLGGFLVGTVTALLLLLTWDKASRFPRFERTGRMVGVAGVAMALLGIPVSLGVTRAIVDASLQCTSNDRDAAIQGCSAALDRGAGNRSDVLFRRGSAYLGKANYDLAIEDFDRLIVLSPGMDAAYLNRGFAYTRKNLPGRAIEDFNKAIRLNPKLALAYLDRGEIYIHDRTFDRAIADETEAIRLDPTLASAYALRAEAYGATDAAEQAIADLSRALELRSADPQLYYRRGVIYASVGRLDAAIADYTESIRRAPTGAAAYNNRAWSFHLKGEDALGLADAEKAVALMPDNKVALETRAEIYEKLGRTAAAIADYQTVLAMEPGERLAQAGLRRLR